MEIVELLRGLSQRFSPKVYIIADTDNKSNLKVLDFEKELESKFGGKSKVMKFKFRFPALYGNLILKTELLM